MADKEKKSAMEEGDLTDANIDSKSPGTPVILKAISVTEPDAIFYNMKSDYRGLGLIFNNKTFDFGRNSPMDRERTDVDVKNLKDAQERAGFQVWVLEDQTRSSIDNILKQVASLDHSNCDCIFITILTYQQDGELFARDFKYNPSMIWNHFTIPKCPSLAGKPKIFFIQGDSIEGGRLSWTQADGIPYRTFRTSVLCDFLVVRSMVPRKWDQSIRGSWFMKFFIEELEERKDDTSILSMLTSVNGKIQVQYDKFNEDKKKRHMPCKFSTLIHTVAFERNTKTKKNNFISEDQKIEMLNNASKKKIF